MFPVHKSRLLRTITKSIILNKINVRKYIKNIYERLLCSPHFYEHF